jgi:hypothetical protein
VNGIAQIGIESIGIVSVAEPRSTANKQEIRDQMIE